MSSKYPITVFTPTYNRKELLTRLYESLLRQTNMDFEWIVVDDASSDGTDSWMRSIQSAPFEIKYHMNQHGGKHRAINKGVELSEGEYFFVVDSDDYLPENAIEIMTGWIADVNGREDLAGISGLRVDPSNHVVGQCPNVAEGQYVECGNLQRYRMNLLGDKAEAFRTDILRKYPFPEFDGEFFMTERIVWDKIAYDGYKVRWYNVPVYICEYQEGGLSNSGANMVKGHLENYRGYVAFIKQSIRIMEPMEAVTYFREYNRIANYKKLSLRQRAKEMDVSPLYYLSYLALKMPVFYSCRLVRKAIAR